MTGPKVFHSVGYIATPLILQKIEVELLQLRGHGDKQPANRNCCSQQHKLDILAAAMQAYRPLYYSVDWVDKTVSHVFDISKRWFSPTIIIGSKCSLLQSWADMLKSHPMYYLRLVTTVDLSISNGRLPEEIEFPTILRDLPHRHICLCPAREDSSLYGCSLVALNSASEVVTNTGCGAWGFANTYQHYSKGEEYNGMDQITALILSMSDSTADTTQDSFFPESFTDSEYLSLPCTDQVTLPPSPQDDRARHEEDSSVDVTTSWNFDITCPETVRDKSVSPEVVLTDEFLEALFRTEKGLLISSAEALDSG